MSTDYKSRIQALRALMAQAGVQAAIVPQADAHLSEYLASHWQLRRWLSGFTGSAGDLVVTADKAALWTDSRYFIQAANQLEGTGIELMKDGLASTPSIAAWLASELKAGDTVGFNGLLFPAPRMEALENALAAKGIRTDCGFDPAAVWSDRPALPSDKIYEHELRFAGRSAEAKIADVLAAVKGAGAEATFISALDEIAWILNIRSNDVRHTPVATAFLFLSEGEPGNILFVDSAKTTPEILEFLRKAGVAVQPYTAAADFLKTLPGGMRVLVETGRTSGAVMRILGDRAVKVAISPATDLKSVKNDVQLDGIRRAMVRDGQALVYAFMEIEKKLTANEPLTEMDVAEILRKHRSKGENYRDESFGTIAGYGPHGAIVHYEATEETNATLRMEGLLLVDSGVQYLDGTTDITRTIALGAPTEEEKRDFTLVMKGHIALATMMFPDDTRGAQLDAIARQYLWREGLSYLHGTGHGVGHFLGVHEGPQSIRLNYVDAPLRPGMITSNEPGLYRADVHGIRCENLVLCRRAISNEFGNFLRFETLTLFPFDLKLIDQFIMTREELNWLDDYHRRVRMLLSPGLDDEAAEWLRDKTRPLNTCSLDGDLPF